MRKILLFHHYNSSLGAGLSLLHIIKSIDFQKYNVTVCLPMIQGDLDKKIKEMGVNLIYSDAVIAYMHFSGNHTSFISKRHFENCKAVIRNKDNIKRIILNQKPDIVVVNSMCLFWIGSIAKSSGAKAVCFHRETYRRGLIGLRTSYIKKHLSEDFDVVVFISNYDLNETPVRRAKYFRITDKVDVQLYDSLDEEKCRKDEGLPFDTNLLLYTGGMAALKGPEVLIKALCLLRHENLKVVFLQYSTQTVIGTKQKIKGIIKKILGLDLQYKLEKYIHENSLEEMIIFRPATDHVETYFKACDAVVFPCKDVHQARPIYEAGAAKKPIIITDFPNYKEFISNENGWLFKRNDEQKLAKCISDALHVKSSEKIRKNYHSVCQQNNLATMPEEIDGIFLKI